MSIPSWEELIEAARKYSIEETETKESVLTSTLLAKGLSDLVREPFLTPIGEKKEDIYGAISTTGGTRAFTPPIKSAEGLSFLERLIRNKEFEGQEKIKEGEVPLERKEFAELLGKQSIQKIKATSRIAEIERQLALQYKRDSPEYLKALSNTLQEIINNAQYNFGGYTTEDVPFYRLRLENVLAQMESKGGVKIKETPKKNITDSLYEGLK